MHCIDQASVFEAKTRPKRMGCMCVSRGCKPSPALIAGMFAPGGIWLEAAFLEDYQSIDAACKPGIHAYLHNADSVDIPTPTCRRLSVVLDRPPTAGFNLSLCDSTLRGCPTRLACVSAAGLLSSTVRLLILMAALKSRFTNSICFFAFIILTNARSPRTCALLSICCSSSAPYCSISSGIRWEISISTL